jgi:regulator of sigma E protease
MMISIVSAIIVLGILIFVHELGHFIFAKTLGVGVEKFSLGFGPKLIGKKMGETEYLISAFPLGGYVKMVGEGDDSPESQKDDPRSFAMKPPLHRIAIVLAGPVFNLLFAVVVFIAVYMIGVPVPTARIGEVMKDKPAARAGVKANDVITSINGKSVDRWDDFASVIADGKGRPVDIQVKRGSEIIPFHIVPETSTVKNLFGETISTPLIGVSASKETFTERSGPIDAVGKGISQSWFYMKLTVLSLVKIIERVVSLDTIGGPIMIAVMSGQQAAAGAISFLAFMALLSINLGVLNLLPIPILDGGHLIFFIFEMIFKRPVRIKTREVAQQVGLVLLVSLMFFATYNDLNRYWKNIVEFFARVLS